MERTHTIIDVIWKTPRVFELVAERNDLAFTPGDSVTLAHSDGSESRPYSIASGARENVLRFLIQPLPGGRVSRDLAQRRPGETVVLSDPFGWFHPGRQADGHPMVFVGTGTGVAPFLSYLRTYPDQKPTLCLVGVRRREDLLDVDDLREGCAELHLAISRETAEGCHHGRVPDLLTSLTLIPGTHFYLCGLDAMIDDVTSLLEARGVHFPEIHREVFFHAPSSYA